MPAPEIASTSGWLLWMLTGSHRLGMSPSTTDKLASECSYMLDYLLHEWMIEGGLVGNAAERGSGPGLDNKRRVFCIAAGRLTY